VLTDLADVPDAQPYQVTETHPSLLQTIDLQKRLWAAKAPVAILGGSRWDPQAIARFQRFAERFDLPVACPSGGRWSSRPTIPNFAGDLGIGPNPKLLQRIQDSDLVLFVGGRLSEMPSQSYTLFGIPEPGRPLVHVHPDRRGTRPRLPAGARDQRLTDRLLRRARGRAAAAGHPVGGRGRRGACRLSRLERSRRRSRAFHPAEMVTWLRNRNCPPTRSYATAPAIMRPGCIASTASRKFATQLAPTSGSMGYGVPAAIAAKRLHPERMVVAFAGDGCFLMNAQDFATAVQYGGLIVVVVDNGMYGTIRMHQERTIPAASRRRC
jgi:acetolactate synthase-1/2/3 large subunit